MSFEWAQYLNVARELIGLQTPPATREARLRAGISRAYYAAFNKARDYMEDVYQIHWVPDGGESHQFVIGWYKTHPDQTFQDIGQLLARLRANRRLADYKKRFTKLEVEAIYSVQAAEEVLRLLETLPQ